ncbi:MAG: SpaH/EbpB family LPXTG-anchored major pilin [Leucobacter sp.]|nr:SpaH/EbpB family LPXTG-anchored major pilin [Leucobacter sp.]
MSRHDTTRVAVLRVPAHGPAIIGVLLSALLLLMMLLPAHAAHAVGPARAAIDPNAVTEIQVHKFEQPPTAGAPATGLPQPTAGLTPVPGAKFTAKKVPGIDLTTNAGQAQAANLTLDQAAALIASQPVAASATTDASGNAALTPLGVGLYYVSETFTPTGYVGSGDFLVALPLTNPDTLNSWLTTVHVYPKNVKVNISLDVNDQDAVTIGDTVHWTSRSDIPKVPTIDGYQVVQKIDSRLELIDDGTHVTVGFDTPGTPPLDLGTHYTKVFDPVTNTITVKFTPAGLTVLESVAQTHPTAQVKIDYSTNVLDEGELVNEALLYPNQASIDGGPGAPDPVKAKNTTKWGPLIIQVHERGNPKHMIPGAKFKLYLTPQDAIDGTNPIVVDGVDEWTTDEDGRLVINGLRFSGFVNGLDRDPSDPLYRYYYAMPTYFPPGWTGVKEPLRATVFSTTEAQVLTVVLWRTSTGGPDETPETGAHLAGYALLGAVLVGAGALLFVRRRNRDAEPSKQ